MRLTLAFSSWLLFHQAGYYFHRAGYYFTNLVTIYEAGCCFLNLVYIHAELVYELVYIHAELVYISPK